MMKLEDRRERGDLIEVFKILNGQKRIDPSQMWEVRKARNGARLVKELAVNGRRRASIFLLLSSDPEMNLAAHGRTVGMI